MKRHIKLGGDKGPIPGGLRPLVTINVRNRQGGFAAVRFCIDTGADFCALPVALAESKGIPFTRDASSRSVVSGLVGNAVKYAGWIDVHLFSENFRWPCAFIESEGSAARFEYGVIGRIGFLESFDACVKHPFCTIQRRMHHLPWWRRAAAKLSPSRLHPFDEPL